MDWEGGRRGALNSAVTLGTPGKPEGSFRKMI
jgi:hypothetical protein